MRHPLRSLVAQSLRARLEDAAGVLSANAGDMLLRAGRTCHRRPSKRHHGLFIISGHRFLPLQWAGALWYSALIGYSLVKRQR